MTIVLMNAKLNKMERNKIINIISYTLLGLVVLNVGTAIMLSGKTRTKAIELSNSEDNKTE